MADPLPSGGPAMVRSSTGPIITIFERALRSFHQLEFKEISPRSKRPRRIIVDVNSL
jgi:hypothetical protein